jgi:hypothetical protein
MNKRLLVGLLLCFASATSGLAQTLTPAEVEEVVQILRRQKIPEDIAIQLTVVAGSDPQGPSIAFGSIGGIGEGQRAPMLHAVCVMRLGDPMHRQAEEKIAELRAKAKLLDLAWKTIISTLAFPDLVAVPTSSSGDIRSVRESKIESDSASLLVCIQSASARDVKLQEEAVLRLWDEYHFALHKLAMRAGMMGDARLLKNVLREYGSRQPIPVAMEPYSLLCEAIDGTGSELVSPKAREICRRWVASGVRDALAWLELVNLFQRIGDSEGHAQALQAARDAALAGRRP